MKLTKEHVGRRVVQGHNQSIKIPFFISDSYVLYKYVDSDVEYHAYNGDEWELYHEPFTVEGREVRVGDRLTQDYWDSGYFLTVLSLSDRGFMARDSRDGAHRLWYTNDPYWKFYQEKKLYAPAIFCSIESSGGLRGEAVNKLTDKLFKSKKHAQSDLGDFFVKWPAIPNKDGFYEI